MALLKITFDTNTLKGAVTPDLYAGKRDHAACLAVHEALRSGRIKGFFSEAIVALDALGRDDKVNVVGGARIESKTHATGAYTVMISIGPRWRRTPINQLFLERLQGALDLGMRAIMGPRRFADSLAVQGFGDDFYDSYSNPTELVARGEKANEVDAALARRGLGHARAVRLGLEYSEREGDGGEWWPQGLGRARDPHERKQVWAAINEWADGDAVAGHVGRGNDLFCTYDYGKKAGQQSALHPTHRGWLTETFGIEFVTLPELARRLACKETTPTRKASTSK
jgi:hypothetical protein